MARNAAVQEVGERDTAGAKPRGRPRSVECHKSILCATNDLLEQHSYGDVTMESIAAHAGVAKQTLYNWWPCKAELVMEAFVARVERRSPMPDTGSFVSDLESYLVGVCELFSGGNMGPTFAGLIAEMQGNQELGRQFREDFIARRRKGATEVVVRGIRRGEVRGDINIEELLDMMYGPLWYRLLLHNAPLDVHFAKAIVAYVLASTTPKQPPKAPRAAPRPNAAKLAPAPKNKTAR